MTLVINFLLLQECGKIVVLSSMCIIVQHYLSLIRLFLEHIKDEEFLSVVERPRARWRKLLVLIFFKIALRCSECNV